jgi:hypothetical protein
MACSREAPDGIPRTTPLSSDGACRFDLTGDKEVTVFFVLGYLDEYLGRVVVEEDDTIERTFKNQDVDGFRRQLDKLAAQQRVGLPIREETADNGGIVFRSRPIADRINSCYRYRLTYAEQVQARDGSYRRVARAAALDTQLFSRHDVEGGRSEGRAGLPEGVFCRRRALAYVAGAWARGHQGDALEFANSKDKAELIAHLLVNLGCKPVRIETTYGYVPSHNTVRFTATDEVREWLAKAW